MLTASTSIIYLSFEAILKELVSPAINGKIFQPQTQTTPKNTTQNTTGNTN